MKVLMCPPLYYEPAEDEEASTVMAEWRSLYRLLCDELDVEVDLLEPRPDMPHLVFAASGGFVREDSFIASRFRDLSRQPEREAWENFFLVRGYDLPTLPDGCSLEGERDLVDAGATPFAGYRSNDDLAAHDAVSEILGREIRSLRLSDNWDWPLDTCFCPLGKGRALFHPDAFHPDARRLLKTELPELLPVDTADARRLGCNALVADGSVILPEGVPATVSGLEEEGLRTHTLPLAAYARHGAGPKAVVLKVEY
jgi:N-dimethylarginine dimethylaminohydrolase